MQIYISLHNLIYVTFVSLPEKAKISIYLLKKLIGCIIVIDTGRNYWKVNLESAEDFTTLCWNVENGFSVGKIGCFYFWKAKGGFQILWKLILGFGIFLIRIVHLAGPGVFSALNLDFCRKVSNKFSILLSWFSVWIVCLSNS